MQVHNRIVMMTISSEAIQCKDYSVINNLSIEQHGSNTTEHDILCFQSPVSIKTTEVAVPIPLDSWFWVSICNAVNHNRISLICLSRILGVHTKFWCHCNRSNCFVIHINSKQEKNSYNYTHIKYVKNSVDGGSINIIIKNTCQSMITKITNS